jgi:hypothetical protein
MRWEQGHAAIDGMLSRGELERVPPSREHADLLLSQAHQHLKSAEAVVAIVAIDPNATSPKRSRVPQPRPAQRHR